MKINNIIEQLLIKYPILGNIIVNLNIKHTKELIPAPAYTDGANIFYTDDFLSDYNEEEQKFIITHEIFHIILNHIYRNTGKDKDLLNYVEDAIINQLLIHDNLQMPPDGVYVEDALNYSVDELYMKFLPRLKDIKKWMNENTYHIEIYNISDITAEMLKQISNDNLQELIAENQELKNELLQNYKEEMRTKADLAYKFGFLEGNSIIPSEAVGKSQPLISWQELLEANITLPSDATTGFFEVQMDGIIKKENQKDEIEAESEIIIDSSGSMGIQKIRAVLRECKNILEHSKIKVGFCDVSFQGWNEINTDDDIDHLEIIGRGGTDFTAMAKSFSKHADNKIIITDGEAQFPSGYPDIIWLIINYCLPFYLDEELLKNYGYQTAPDDINYIYIDERKITTPTYDNKLTLTKSNNKRIQ